MCMWISPGSLPPSSVLSSSKNRDVSVFSVVMSTEICKSENCIASTSDKGESHMNYILTTRPEPQIFFYPRRCYAVVALPLHPFPCTRGAALSREAGGLTSKTSTMVKNLIRGMHNFQPLFSMDICELVAVIPSDA